MVTYRGFHYRITVPLLAVCIALWTQTKPSSEVLLPLLFLNVIVVLFTYPWDNWAVRRRLWDFPEERLLFRVDRLPVEEIAFFVLQTLQVSFLTLSLCALYPGSSSGSVMFDMQTQITLGGLLAAWIIGGVATKRWRAQKQSITYAWHLLFWFSPVIVAQWLFGWEIFVERWPVIACSTMIIGGLLSIADVWAVRRGIWFFDAKQITGVYVANILPWEEVAFFFITSLLVAQSTLLLAPAALR